MLSLLQVKLSILMMIKEGNVFKTFNYLYILNFFIIIFNFNNI